MVGCGMGARWLVGESELTGQPISRQQGWEYLKQMRFRLRVPRPQHQEADLDEQEAWKKKSGQRGQASTTTTPRRRRRTLVRG